MWSVIVYGFYSLKPVSNYLEKGRSQDYVDTAQALTEAGKVSQAILAYNNAIKFDPKNADIRWQLGKLLLDQGRHQDAITEFKHVVNLQPDLVAARLDLARLAMRMGEKKERKKRTDSPRKKRTEKERTVLEKQRCLCLSAILRA